jgi:hypothetical protein
MAAVLCVQLLCAEVLCAAFIAANEKNGRRYSTSKPAATCCCCDPCTTYCETGECSDDCNPRQCSCEGCYHARADSCWRWRRSVDIDAPDCNSTAACCYWSSVGCAYCTFCMACIGDHADAGGGGDDDEHGHRPARNEVVPPGKRNHRNRHFTPLMACPTCEEVTDCVQRIALSCLDCRVSCSEHCHNVCGCCRVCCNGDDEPPEAADAPVKPLVIDRGTNSIVASLIAAPAGAPRATQRRNRDHDSPPRNTSGASPASRVTPSPARVRAAPREETAAEVFAAQVARDLAEMKAAPPRPQPAVTAAQPTRSAAADEPADIDLGATLSALDRRPQAELAHLSFADALAEEFRHDFRASMSVPADTTSMHFSNPLHAASPLAPLAARREAAVYDAPAKGGGGFIAPVTAAPGRSQRQRAQSTSARSAPRAGAVPTLPDDYFNL